MLNAKIVAIKAGFFFFEKLEKCWNARMKAWGIRGNPIASACDVIFEAAINFVKRERSVEKRLD